MSETPSSIDLELDAMLGEDERVKGLADLISRRRRYYENPERDKNSVALPIDYETALIGAKLAQLWRSYYVNSLSPNDKYLAPDDFRNKVEAAKSEAIANMQSNLDYKDNSFGPPVMIAATDAFFLMSPAAESDSQALHWGMEPYSDVLKSAAQRVDS